MSNEIDVYKVVTKLIGPINPIGESETDAIRLNNLKEMCKLVDSLLTDIDGIIPNKRRYESSMKIAGEYADKFFTNIGIIE